MIITEEVYLEHFGVKGMKWGVRRDRRAQTHAKVGRGEGTRGERLRSAVQIGPKDFIKGRGLQGAARIKGARQLERNARVRSGQGSVRDKLAYVGGTRYQDMFPTGKSANNTKAAIGASVVGAFLFAQGAQILSKSLKG